LESVNVARAFQKVNLKRSAETGNTTERRAKNYYGGDQYNLLA